MQPFAESSCMQWRHIGVKVPSSPVGPQLNGQRAMRLTRWQSIFTTGVVMLGVHMDTTPLACPSCITPFQGFCRMTSHVPIFVLCCAMIWPVLVSCPPAHHILDEDEIHQEIFVQVVSCLSEPARSKQASICDFRAAVTTVAASNGEFT